uniref:Uncharacterized protein n=1 Tax=Anguilla anguilla TaxID=7936 RepID=A0A0E9SFL1_ANGAN
MVCMVGYIHISAKIIIIKKNRKRSKLKKH